MRKSLKFVIVMSIILTMLMGNVSVLASSVIDVASNSQVADEINDSEQVDDEINNSEQVDEEINDGYKTNEEVDNDEQVSKENDKITSANEGSEGNMEEPKKEETSENEESLETKENLEEQEKIETISNATTRIASELGSGKVFISLDLRLPQAKQENSDQSIFTVTLRNKNGELSGIKPEFYRGFREREDETKLYYTFNYVPVGEYTVEITKTGYAKFTRSVQIKTGTISELSLTNGYNEDKLDVLREGQIGVVAVGDVTGDEKVLGYDSNGKALAGVTSTNNDEEAMIKAIEDYSKDSSTYNSKYDLNGDGKINIIDLSYISINKNNEAIKGVIIESVDITKATVEESKTTTINEEHGEVKDILENNDKYITLEPKNKEADISKDNPVEISIDLGENVQAETQEITIAPSSNVENNIEAAIITVETVDGQKVNVEVRNTSAIAFKPVAYNTISNPVAVIEPDGTISVDLGNKVAVKKITIKVTATKSNKFADIAKVEFLNGNVDRIPAPDLSIPTNIKWESFGESFTVTWDNMQNVTGYEVRIVATVKGEEKTNEYVVDGNSITISDFFGAVKDNIPCDYYVAVQSVNGEWRSGYSDAVKVVVDAVKRPDKPDNVTLKGGIREIKASWKKMNATDSYKVFYRKYNEGEYIEATKGQILKEPSFTITGLEDSQRYQVYIIGVNKIGESDRSNISDVETVNIQPAILPSYKLINTPNGEGKLTSHIKSIVKKSMGNMVDSPLDTDANGKQIQVEPGKYSAKGVVDNSYNSYLQIDDWDFGVSYEKYSEKGIEVTFDKTYKMNYFTMAQIENLDHIRDAKIWYKDKETGETVGPISASQVVTKTGENGREYTVIKLDKPIETDTVQIAVTRVYGYIRKITIAEMRFYEYDSLEEDINNLYLDQMHTTLKDTVTLDDFEELQQRLDTKDSLSNEYHPEKDSLQKELDLAKLIYETDNLKDVIKIDTSVTKAKDGHITFSSGLNDWQPLGIVAHSTEVIKVFVGSPNKNSGDTTNLNLIATQYYPEAAAWYATAKSKLKVGMNEITIPKIDNQDKESGGSLYIEYTGNNPNEIYGVRVVGGEYIPVLDLTKVENNKEKRLEAVKEYVQKLETTVSSLESAHNIHRATGAKEFNYDYNEKNCILGATEIVLDQMMYSVSAKQILTGLGEGSLDEKAQKLYNSLEAMEDMIDLFYQHKGLNKDTTERTKNTYPSSRLNIRYHQMFGGAAMYAGGLHIGIDWGDVPTLSKGNPIKTETVGKDGKYVEGNYFGWGISHEIGHIINESAYVHGEVTNNYFSVLSQAKDTNESVRFEYREVYKKVMSGKTGKAQNVFTQLGLYWQLHLAYDKDGYNFKTYTDYEEQQKNLLFARMDSYARDPASAPKAEGDKGIALKLCDSKDDNLIRLSCAAAEKNLLEFFTKWGMTPNEETIEYASQWEEETRAIYFINDEARAYELAGNSRMTEGTKVTAEREIVQKDIDGSLTNTNQVKLTMKTTNEVKGAILGYEIIRTYMDNDQEITVPVAFVTVDDNQEESSAKGEITYIDTIETVNNRVFTYKVKAYDKYLNETAECVLDPIKVENDGTIGGKEDWVITTNLTSTEDAKKVDRDSEKYDMTEPQLVKVDSELIDKDYSKDYNGTTSEDKAKIVIELEETKKLVGFKYTSESGKELNNCTVSVSKDGKSWTEVKKVDTELFSSDENTKIVYFGTGDKLEIYDATFVKFEIDEKEKPEDGEEVSIAEIDLIGPTGDNVDFIKTADGTYSGYGVLANDVTLGSSDTTGETIKIPAGSIVFTGTYKGNPAYNALKLWDQDNNLLTGSEQTFYAEPLEKDAKITDVTGGIWIYWLPKEIYMDEDGNQVDNAEKGKLTANPMYEKFLNPKEGTTVRAELYRVNDAHELTGERITSDTYRVPIKSELPSITITSDGKVE